MRETTIGKRLLPLIQLLPAAVVAAVVLIALPGTQPVLAEIPERLSPPASSAETAVEEEAPAGKEVLPALPYADGTYTGSSRGYGGTVKVQVIMEGGAMTDIRILDASHETAAFLKRARRLVNTMLEAQSFEVDAVSEATYTSRGILGAVKNALTGEVIHNPLPPQPKPAQPPVVEEIPLPSVYLDGVYTASADGFGGPITVQVTVAGDTITDITILSAEGETMSYFTRARYVISSILDSGSTEVDTVSGATYSSTGILNAVRLALAKAAAAPETEEPQPEPPTEDLADSTPPQEEAPAVQEPTVEVVQAPERSDALEWIADLWNTLFPEQPAESSAAPTVIFEAAPPQQTEEAAGPQPEPRPEATPEPGSAASEEGNE